MGRFYNDFLISKHYLGKITNNYNNTCLQLITQFIFCNKFLCCKKYICKLKITGICSQKSKSLLSVCFVTQKFQMFNLKIYCMQSIIKTSRLLKT